MNRQGIGSRIQKTPKGGFVSRLAQTLGLKSHESHTFDIASSKGVVKVTIGKETSGNRPLRLRGLLRWQGMEYEIGIDHMSGSGVLDPNDDAWVHDRTIGSTHRGDLPSRVFRALLPLIELEVSDIFRRARLKKH